MLIDIEIQQKKVIWMTFDLKVIICAISLVPLPDSTVFPLSMQITPFQLVVDLADPESFEETVFPLFCVWNRDIFSQ